MINSSTSKFTWLFLATHTGDTTASIILRTTAATEEDARAAFPGQELIFVAKIRTESPQLIQNGILLEGWVDVDSCTSWTINGSDVGYVKKMAGLYHV